MGTITFESTACNWSVRHWQKGTTQVLSVKRRRALATFASCGISICLP